ncbi:prostate stem cell antigen-like [Gigantopelta aegis]|uniref:prostate stem cell antigen-like n=1 Tax=Gigantopelta aegis TaxID=1735272 RepID=UPI001B88B3C4|nr:prostate stem cell antigen-like [Gigantopelta aegis]
MLFHLAAITGIALLVLCLVSRVRSVKILQVNADQPLPPDRLHCYYCFEYEDDCISMENTSNIRGRECEIEEHYCRVKLLHTEGVLRTFERDCARECTPGCQTVMAHKKCQSCCSTNFCNSNNHGVRRATSATTFTTALVVSALMLISRR